MSTIVEQKILQSKGIGCIKELNYDDSTLFHAYLNILIDYLYRDEYKHYLECGGGESGIHIFQILKELKRMNKHCSRNH